MESTFPQAFRAGTLRLGEVSLDLAALAIPSRARRPVRLALFGDLALSAVMERGLAVGDGAHAWSGRLLGDEGGRIVVALTADGAFAAGVRSRFGRFQILSADGRRGWVRQIDPFYPARQEVLTGPPETGEAAADEAAGGPSASREVVGVTEIDLLFIFTRAARGEAGGVPELRALIALEVAELNEVYAASKVRLRARVAAVEKVDYRESRSGTDRERVTRDLERLTFVRSRHLSDARELRSAHRADFVLLVENTRSEVCSLSWLFHQVNERRANWAFSVLDAGCLGAGDRLARALGYNMSLHPARGDSRYRPGRPYAYAFRDPAGRFQTVMARRCDDCPPTIPHYSSPKVLYRGMRTGVGRAQPDSADNARALNRDRRYFAAYGEYSCTINPVPGCQKSRSDP